MFLNPKGTTTEFNVVIANTGNIRVGKSHINVKDVEKKECIHKGLIVNCMRESMKNLSEDEIQELCHEYCSDCRNYKWYDDDSTECMLSWNVEYVPDEGCECEDFVPIGLPDEPCDSYLGLFDHKIDGEWY